jgi:hypothetical protein
MTSPGHVTHRNRSLLAARLTTALLATVAGAGLLLTGHLLQLASPAQAASVPGTQPVVAAAGGQPR